MNNAPSSREDLDNAPNRNTWELLSVMLRQGPIRAATPVEWTYLIRLEAQGFVQRTASDVNGDLWSVTENGRRYSNQAEPPFHVVLERSEQQ